MTLFLRNRNNQTIVDIEIFTEDGYVELHSFIDIPRYSKLLLEFISEKSENEIKKFIRIFRYLSELRGWLWEDYFAGRKNTAAEKSEVVKKVTSILKSVAEKYNLLFVVD